MDGARLKNGERERSSHILPYLPPRAHPKPFQPRVQEVPLGQAPLLVVQYDDLREGEREKRGK